ncbi:MAG: hypothetical protein JNM45_14590 [Rhizobiales bacterium]|nr:hypothetical protein [Hyphomicrobiales bacterium]
MTDRALSLFRTVLHPVLSSLRLRTGGNGNLPVAPHHSVPALNLSGIILSRPRQGGDFNSTLAGAHMAEAMYGGIYEFGGARVDALPDAVFASAAPSKDWRSGLLRLEWLAGFRASGRPVHGLFALRLLAAWMKAHPQCASAADQVAALFSLAVDAPAIAAEQSPAAIALATAAILRAQGPVLKIKPASAEEAFARASALLAAHLATRRGDPQRLKLVQELTDALSALLHPDGSLRQGSIDDLCRLAARLWTLTDGLTRAGDGVPSGLSALVARIGSYLALVTRGDGTLAFAEAPELQSPSAALPLQGSALAGDAGHARLAGGQTLLHVALQNAAHAHGLRLEMSDGGRALIWLEQHGTRSGTGGGSHALHCAPGGTLLEQHGGDGPADPCHLAIFLSGDGSDIRLEDRTAPHDGTAYLVHVPETAKLSTTHNGSGAMILPAVGQPWQVLVRGGIIDVEHGCFRISAGPDDGHPLNFALKRVPRSDRAPAGRPAPARQPRGRERPPANPRLL